MLVQYNTTKTTRWVSILHSICKKQLTNPFGLLNLGSLSARRN
jgi:hypothetical protein